METFQTKHLTKKKAITCNAKDLPNTPPLSYFTSCLLYTVSYSNKMWNAKNKPLKKDVLKTA